MLGINSSGLRSREGRVSRCVETHHLGKVCRTKCIGPTGLGGLNFGSPGTDLLLETRFRALLLVQVSKPIQRILTLKVGGVPTGFVLEFVRAAPNALALLPL